MSVDGYMPVSADPRWMQAYEEATCEVVGESAHDKLLRQIAASVAMFVVEVEHEEAVSGRPVAVNDLPPGLRSLAMLVLGRGK